jgi:GTPase-associated protein 1, N-terminal domain type 2/GTPase-associated protein 1, middle domain
MLSISLPPAPEVANALALEQLYITYCLYGEGIFSEAGFAVRASSTRDPLLLRFAAEYPLYESPDAGNADSPLVPEDFARLALIRLPGGLNALIHTVSHPGAGGRVNNFFSHALARSTLSARDALVTWASPDWVNRCPRGQGKELPTLDSLPRPGPLNDQAVTAFLQKTFSDGEPGSATLFCPERLGMWGLRRELLAQTLRGCLMATQAGPASARGRFTIRAEPSLTALLLYAAVRILPPRLVAGLTFSTYEAPFALRAYRQAQIVGTWSANSADTLEDAFFLTRGYALDTVSQRASPELLEPGDPVISEWIDLAADGEWKVLDGLYALMGDTTGSLVSVRQAFQAARQTRRFVTGRAETVDVLALKRSRDGQALLAQHRDKVRAILLGADLADPALQHELADLLPESEILHLEQTIAHALQGGLATDWQKPWRLLKAALRSNPERLRETLPRILPPPPFPAGLRVLMLRELRDMELPPSQQRQFLHPVLRGCTGEELEELASSGLPPEWFAWAICYALLKKESQAEAVRRLLGGSDDIVRAFWGQLEQVKDERQRRAILAPLLSPADGPGALLLGRSLQNRCAIKAETLEWVLEELKAFSPGWADFWKGNGHTRQLLDILLDLGEEGGPLWSRLARQITADLLFGDPHQTALLANLVVAKERAGHAMPESATQFVADWASFREHFVSASAAPTEERQPIIDTCRRLGLDPVELMRRYFERFLLAREMSADQLADFAGFFHSFYPEPSWYEDHERRFAGWLTVVEVCPDERQRAAYQGYYLEHQVPAQLRERLTDETRKAGSLLAGAVEPRPAPPPSACATKEPPPSLAVTAPVSGGLFEATGVGEAGAPTLSAFMWAALWMLVSVAGGCLAAFVFGLGSLPARTVVILAPFLPLVIATAEGAALFACALTGRTLRRGDLRAAHLKMLSVGLCVGGIAGALGACLAVAQGSSIMTATWLGVTILSGTTAGLLAGLAVPLLTSVAGLQHRIAAGPLARVVASVAAIGSFVSLARWLLP